MYRYLLGCFVICLLAVGFFTLLPDNPSSASSTEIKQMSQPKALLPNLNFGGQNEGDLSTIADSGSSPTVTRTALPRTITGTTTKEKPKMSPEQIRAQFDAYKKQIGGKKKFNIPEGPPARVAPIPPPTVAPQMPVQQKGSAPSAPNDVVIFRQHDMSAAEIALNDRSGGAHEPTVINLGDTVFYTANWYAARSTNGGQNFTYINPYTNFPSAAGGFCCDQVTAYAPNQDMAIWGLQYVNNASGNVFRVARAIGSAGVNANSWSYYDFTAQNMGFASGIWMDFPNMAVSTNYLYIASNAYTFAGNFAGNVVWRISLAELAAGGQINYNIFMRTDVNTFKLTENSGTTMFFVATPTTTQMRIFRWDDGPGNINWDTVNLNAFTYFNSGAVSMTGDGRNWAAMADSRPLGAYVAGGVIGVLWAARQDANFPHPYTIHARFNAQTRALITQTPIWNPAYAWLYPAVTVNAAGNLGGVIAYGGGTDPNVPAFPNKAFWIIDDIQSNTGIGGVYTVMTSNAGPSGNRWGDYLTIRPHSRSRNTWVASIFGLTGTTLVPRYIWIGRERDAGGARAFCDFDGDGKTDVSVFRPSNGAWYLQRSTAGFTGITFGQNGDRIVPADYDGDGKTDVAVFRGGTWYLNRSQLGFTGITFGAATDIPMPADYDGDGKADVAVFRPSTGVWYLQRSTLGFTGVSFGANGDVPVAADYDADAKADVAVFRPSTGIWYLQRSQLGFTGVSFGAANIDKPVAADYDGDGKTDIAVFRTTTGVWYLQRSTLGFTGVSFGVGSDLPVPGDYDGDSKADLGVFRNGTWYLQRTTAGFTGVSFGSGTDKPAPNAYIP
jgi:hypothetical protein